MADWGICSVSGAFLAGNAIFTVASVLCGMSWSIGTLIAFRAIQAAGAGMTAALARQLSHQYFPRRKESVGTQGMVVALGLAIGPLGGTYWISGVGEHLFYQLTYWYHSSNCLL